MNNDIQTGRSYPVGDLREVHEQAAAALFAWFEAHGIPRQVQDLADLLGMLYACANAQGAGQLSDQDAAWLSEGVPHVLALVQSLEIN